MHTTGMRVRVFVFAVALFAGNVRAADLPPAFSDVTLDAAKKQVEGSDKIVVIKFTAEWCPPCKAMDKTTWRDQSVVKWVKDHGVALQVDVDKDQKTARAYNIEAMPTMVMLRGGKEIARTLGYMKPEEMLSWMEAAATGKVPTTATTPATKKPAAVERSPVQLLIVQLDENLEKKKYDEAAVTIQELWSDSNARDPMRQIGLATELRGQLSAAVKGTPRAKAAIEAIRDSIEKQSGERSIEMIGQLNDWLAFNSILGDDARSLAWLDRSKADTGGRANIEIAFSEVAPVLLRNGRAAEIAEVFPDATERLQKRYDEISPAAKSLSVTDPKQGERVWMGFETLGAQVFAGFVAAKNIKDANMIAEEMLQLRDTPTMRVALVRESLNAGVVGPGVNLWLDEAAKSGQDVSALRTRMAALQKK
ncbi:MAG: thioredoxin family protein [Phycisphaerales bacterium]|nr:thioredoxin family protein [Phycisphaerales bacterium]